MRASRIELARVCEARLEDAGAAFAMWMEILEGDLFDADAASEAARIGEALGTLEAVEILLREGARKLDLPADRTRLRVRAAQIAFERRNDTGAALEVCHEALKDDPNQTDALALRARILVQANDYEGMLAHYDHIARHDPTPERRREARLEAAALCVDKLDEPQRALDLLDAQLAESEDDSDCYRLYELYGDLASERAHSREGARLVQERVATQLEMECLALADADQEADAEAKLATRVWTRLGDANGAATRALSSLAKVQGHAEALDVLDAVLDSDQVPQDLVATIAEALTKGHGASNPARLAAVMHRAADLDDTPARKVDWLERAALVERDRIGDPTVHAETRIAMARLQPERSELWEAAGDAVGKAGDSDRVRLAEVLLERALEAFASAQEPELKLVHAMRVAQLSGLAGRQDDRIEYLRMALAVDSRREPARVAMREALEKAGRTEELALFYEEDATLTSDRELRELSLEEALHLWLDVLGNKERSVELLGSLLEIDAAREDREDKRIGLLSELGDRARLDAALRSALANAAAHGHVGRARSLRLRLTTAVLDGNAPGAVGGLLAEAIRWVGDNLAVDVHDVLSVALAERLLDRQEIDSDQRRTLADWIEHGLDAAQGDSAARWAAARAISAEETSDVTERQRIFDELSVHARDVLKDPEAAVAWALRAHAVEPGHPDRIGGLVALADSVPAAAMVVAALEEAIAATSDTSAKVAMARAAAPLCRSKLGDEARAIACFRVIVDAGEADIEAFLECESAAEAPADRATLLARRAEVFISGEEARDVRLDALVSLAELCRGPLGDTLRARDTLHEVTIDDPQHAGAWRGLLEMAREMQDDAGVADAVRALADILGTQDQAERLALLVERAASLDNLCADGAMAPDEVASAWRDVLAVVPDHRAALTRLPPLLEAAGKEAEAVDALGALASHSAGADLADAEARAGSLLMSLDRKDEAITAWGRALAVDPTLEQVLDGLDALSREERYMAPVAAVLVPALEKGENWKRMVQLERRRIGMMPPSERVTPALQLASVLDAKLDKPVEALDALLEVFRPCPGDVALRETLVALVTRLGQQERLITAAEETSIDLGDDLDVSLSLLGLAATLAEQTGDLDRAASIRMHAWDLAPMTDLVRDEALRLHEAREDWESLAGALERAIDLAFGEEVIGFKRKLAAVEMDRMGRHDRAFVHLRAILSAHPEDADSLERVEMLTGEPSVSKDALDFLEPIYRARGAWDSFATVLVRRLEAASEPSTRATLGRSLAALYEQRLGDPASALAYLQVALSASPMMDTLVDVERLSSALGDRDAMKQALESMLGAKLSAEARVDLLWRAASFHQAEKDGQKKVEELLRELVTLNPAHVEALELLDFYYDGESRWAELVDILELEVKAVSDLDARRALLNRMGGTARASRLGPKAIAAYEELAALDPSDPDPLDSLIELLDVASAHDRLVRVLELRAGLPAPRGQRAEWLARAGRLAADRLGEPTRSRALYERAFDTDPANDEAFVALERSAEAADDVTTLDRVYRMRGGSTTDEGARIRALRKLADVRERRVGDPEGAIEALKLALEIDKSNLPVIDELLRMLHRERRASELVDVYELKLGVVNVPAEKTALTLKAAEVALRSLGDPERALRLLDRVREGAGASRDFKRLQTLAFARRGEPKDAAARLEEVIASTQERDHKVEAIMELAALAAGPLADQGKALRCYQQVLSLQPDNREALAALLALYRSRESWEALAETLRKALSHTQEPAERLPLLVELGEVVGTRLGDRRDALKVLEEAYESKQDDPGLNRLLAQIFEADGTLNRAARLREWVVQYLDAKRMYADVPREATETAGLLERIGDATKARDYYKLALERDGSYGPAALGLARLTLAEGDQDKAMRLFEALVRKPQQLENDAQRAEAYFGLGKASLEEGKKTKARECFERALALAPSHAEAKEALRKIR